MYDVIILCFYTMLAITSKNSRLLAVCAIPLITAIVIPESYYHIDAIPATFSAFAILTSSIALFMYMKKIKLTAYSLLLLAFYDIIFAIDSTVNKENETWIYNNHENIVIGLHFIVMLSFSKFISSRVGFSFRDIGRASHDFKCDYKNK